jgi:hypothetical protein
MTAKPPGYPAAAFARWNKMDRNEIKAANEYLAWCQAQLGQSHWDVYVGDIPAEPDCNAAINSMENRWTADVRLNPDWPALSAERQANCLLHEVLHLAHHDLSEMIRCELPANFRGSNGQIRYESFQERSMTATERMVDQVATALCTALGALEVWKGIREKYHLEWSDEPIPFEPTDVRPKLVAAQETTSPEA